jgi:hypothetical protein
MVTRIRFTQYWALSVAILMALGSAYLHLKAQSIDPHKNLSTRSLKGQIGEKSHSYLKLPWPTSGQPCEGIRVSTLKQLQSAIKSSKPGNIIALTDGVFTLKKSLTLKAGTSLCGQGAGKTIIQSDRTWQPNSSQLPGQEDPNAYLIIIDKQDTITIRDMSLRGPSVHGAIYGNRATGLTLSGLEIRDFVWSSVRTFGMQQMHVHDNDFIDAGGRFKNTTGGALYDHYPIGCKVWNNRVRHSAGNSRPFYGFKGHGGRNCRFHNNEIRQNFAIEYPHANNIGFEIDHNYIQGTISIPKYAGGSVLDQNTLSFHIHHNVIRSSYALEFARNNVRINHNLFDIDPQNDKGNLIGNFGNIAAPGMLWMHDNLIKNIGRGVFWSVGVYNNIDFKNNHVRAFTSPRTSALFQFNGNTDFQTITIDSNIFESSPENQRPLLVNGIGAASNIQNNQFSNISDTNAYKNPITGNPIGPREPLQFSVGVHNNIQVNQWDVSEQMP